MGARRGFAGAAGAPPGRGAPPDAGSAPPRAASAPAWLELLLLAAVWGGVLVAPFTKVEESFGVQAAHDFLAAGSGEWGFPPAFSAFDHREFPGVVPRSCLGPALAALLAAPASLAARLLGGGGASPLVGLYCVRLALGFLSFLALRDLSRAARSVFGPLVESLFLLVCALQFHLPFYASRLLPNTWALTLAAVGAAALLRGDARRMTFCLVPAAVMFRCDMVLLAGPALILAVGQGRLGFLGAIRAGLKASLLSLAVSVPLDSAFWGRPVWPEFEVLLFNDPRGAGGGRSSDWGTSPAHWYFSSALPRALLGALPLVPLGLVLEPRVRWPGALALLYTALYSLLPHKELRFLLPVLPLLNLCAACGGAKLLEARGSLGGTGRLARRLPALALAGLLAASAFAAAVMLRASALNYPGGYAFEQLHASGQEPGSVHVGNLAATTGVSRFGERRGEGWKYSKEEGLDGVAALAARGFDYLVTEEAAVPGYEAVGEPVPGFAGLKVGLQPGGLGLPSLTFRTSTALRVLRRQSPDAEREAGGTAADDVA